ncbi:MAG: carboxypeptidase regulatory-like domain-containing protein [Alphaproteobacteria bacterium]|nr:carboxypeptidase regulatory-like domain-containing protein [Alphaproteobacteria bacterium]
MSAGIDWRAMVRHRFFYVPVALAILTAGWNAYVAAYDDGLIEGEVHDAAGKPIPGATVIFFERNFVNYQEKFRATTDAAGRFRFTDMQVHIGQLEARVEDGRRSERFQMNLWFRSQNVQLPPLVLGSPRA